jgi:flagella basal body P-ring formation protein FlgA
LKSKLLFILLIAAAAHAESPAASESLSSRLSDLIRASLTEKIADAEIRLPSLEKIANQKPLNEYRDLKRARLIEDRPNGVALFEVSGTLEDGSERADLIQTPYSAWKKAWVAAKRLYPNTRLKDEDFKISEINVATGPAREYRGVMLPADTRFSGLQTKQTLLEGQFAVTSAVERQPDLRKGDQVRLDLISGDLTLTTQGMAEEPASVGDHVRIMTSKTKKEVVGILKEDRSVEVQL